MDKMLFERDIRNFKLGYEYLSNHEYHKALDAADTIVSTRKRLNLIYAILYTIISESDDDVLIKKAKNTLHGIYSKNLN